MFDTNPELAIALGLNGTEYIIGASWHLEEEEILRMPSPVSGTSYPEEPARQFSHIQREADILTFITLL